MTATRGGVSVGTALALQPALGAPHTHAGAPTSGSTPTVLHSPRGCFTPDSLQLEMGVGVEDEPGVWALRAPCVFPRVRPGSQGRWLPAASLPDLTRCLRGR